MMDQVHTSAETETSESQLPDRSRPCDPLAVRAFGLTDPGRARESNEDQFLVARLVKALQVQWTSLPQPALNRSHDRSHLFVVADGMGGHAAGERASALAIDSVESFVLDSLKWFAHCEGDDEDRVLTELKRSVRQASLRVEAEGASRPELDGMGTTLTVAYTLNDELFVAHAGDTRCYLLRDRTLHRLTRDHTLIDEMLRHGQISPEQAKHHHWRHVIINALGGGCPEIDVELHKLRLHANDKLLLCSDGLTEMLSDEQIANILQNESDPEHACRKLVKAANHEGGKDNITVVIAHFDAEEIQGSETAA